MIIEDQELRTLFKAESDEHLQKLEEGLLRLESTPEDLSTLEALFREAHSLKGAAAMLGVEDVETLAHRFEDALGAAKRQEAALTPEAIDGMCRALDDIRSLVAQAVNDEPAPSAVESDSNSKSIVQPAFDQDAVTATPTRHHQNETIRVEPHKLDALMTETAELMAVKTRIAHRAVQADRIIEMWEEWNRSRNRENPEEFGALLYQLRDDVHEDGARLEFSASRLDESVRAVRLLPFSTIFNLFPRLVRDIAREQRKEVRIVIQGERIAADKRLLEEIKDPLMHMIRNAVDHGIETPSEREERGKLRFATIQLSAAQKGSAIVIEVSDNGRGLSPDSIKATAKKRGVAPQGDLDSMTLQEIQSLIFVPGFSTRAAVTGISGRGVGMDVVRASIEKLKGSVSFESTPGSGCTFRIQLPASLATSRVLLVGIGPELYALPMEFIHSTRFVTVSDVFMLDGRESILVDGRPVSLVPLFHMLELAAVRPSSPRAGQPRSCVVFEVGHDLLALTVDELLDEQEVVVRPLGSILKRVRNVSGAAILVTGSVCAVLNPLDLLESVRKGSRQARATPEAVVEAAKRVILLVDDSITTRTWEKRCLEASGYEVVAAVDGLDALQKLSQRSFDAVVSDVQMPNMDGLALTERIRQDKKNKELPIVLVTSLADPADRRRGIEAGANAYIPKQTFNQQLLVETLGRFV